jgi:hypothetical protein
MLAEAFWPGSNTCTKKKNTIPDSITAGKKYSSC